MTSPVRSPKTGVLSKRWPVGLAGVSLMLLLIPQPATGRAMNAAMDLLHGPLFALLAVLFFRMGRSESPPRCWVRGILLWVMISLAGLLVEFLQQQVGRQASWQDAAANALGAAAGLLWTVPSPTSWTQKGLRFTSVLLLLLAIGSPLLTLIDVADQYQRMPVLASFESPLEVTRWSAQDCRFKRVHRHATEGDWALLVDLGTAEYLGLSLPSFPADWASYQTLLFDVTLEHPQSLPLIVKLYDQRHNWETEDRFHHPVQLTPGLQQVRIRLWDVQLAPRGRLMDLSRMEGIQLFTVNPPEPARIYIDHVRLE